MKWEFVWGILPVILVQKEYINSEKRTCNRFLCVSFVQDINDTVQIEHEKVIIKMNYIMTLVTALVIGLAYFINIYLMLLMAAIYFFAIFVLYGTDVGVYHRDIRGYAASARAYAKKHDVSLDRAVDHYVGIVINSDRYGDFTKNIGVERIKQDLLNE